MVPLVRRALSLNRYDRLDWSSHCNLAECTFFVFSHTHYTQAALFASLIRFGRQHRSCLIASISKVSLLLDRETIKAPFSK